MADELRDALKTLRRDPADTQALATCEAVLAEKDRWGDLVRLYEDLAVRAPAEQAAGLFCKAGNLWRDHLGNREGARAAYRRSLKFAETVEALEALVALARDARDRWRTAVLLERQAAATAEAAARSTLYVQAAELYRDRLQRPSRAAALFRQALLATPDRRELFSAELALHRQRGNWVEVVRALEALAEAAPPAEVLGEVYLEAAEALAEAPLQGERALECVARAAELVPDDARIEEIRTLIESERADWEQRVKSLREAALDAQNKLEASRIYLRVADLYLTCGQDANKAVENVERSLLLHPGNLGAVQFLERVYGEEDRYAELADLLEKVAAGLLEDEPRVEVHLKLALLCTAHLQDAERAARHYRAVLRADGANPVAVDALTEHLLTQDDAAGCADLLETAAHATRVPDQEMAYLQGAAEHRQAAEDPEGARRDLERLLELDPYERPALETLARLYQAAGQWEQQIGVLERIAALQAGAERLATLVQVARVLEADLEDPERTFDALLAALRHAPEESGLRRELGELAAGTGRFRDLARAYEEALEAVDAPELAAELLFELAELYKGQLEDFRRAEECYQRILEQEPANHRAFGALTSLLELGERWQGMVELLAARAASMAETDPASAAADLKQVAGLYRDRLRAPLQAIEQLKQVLQLTPEDVAVGDELKKLLRSEKRWQEYAELLRAQAAGAGEPGVRQALLLEMAEILEVQAGDLPAAIAAAEEILALAPEDLAAVQRVARLKRHAGDWHGLSAALGRALELAAGDAEQTRALQLELAAVQEWQLADPVAASETYAQVLNDDPGSQHAVEALERLLEVPDAASRVATALAPVYEARADWSRLVKVLKVKLEDLSGRARNKLQKKINKITEKNLKRVDEAFEGYAAAFREEPASENARAEVERLAADTGRWADLVELYLTAADAVDDAAVARSLRLAAAQLEVERLGRLEEALEHYDLLRTADPDDQEVLQALSDLYGRLRRHEELAALLFDRASRLTDDVEQATALYLQAADLREELLDDPTGATAALRGALEHDPENRELLGRLARLCERASDWPGLSEVLSRTLALAGGPEEQRALKVMLADLAQERLDEADRAIELYREVLEEEPDNEDALGGLEEYLEDAERKLGVAEWLLPLYRTGEDWSRAIEALEVLAGAAADAAARRPLLDEVAEIYRDRLGRKDMVFVLCLRRLRESPDDDELRAETERLAAELGAWDELVATYEELLNEADDELWVQLRDRLAQICADELDDAARALEHHRALLASEPSREASRLAVLTLLRNLELWEDLAGALEEEVARAAEREDAARHRELLLDLGSVTRERLDDAPRAINAYEALAALDPADRTVAVTRISLYREAHRWEALAMLLREQADAIDDPDLALAHRLDLADVLERELERIAEAITVYARVVQMDEPPNEAVAALERLSASGEHRRAAAEVLAPYYERTGDHRRRIEALEIQLEEEEEAARRRELVLEIARLYEERLENPSLAFVALCRPFREDPTDAELESRLATLARAAGQEEDLAAVYEEVLEGELEPEARVALGLKLAELLARDPERREEARGAYRRVLEWDPDNAQAFGALAALTEEGGDWSEVVETLNARLERIGEAPEASPLWLQLGDIQLAKLQAPADAITSYRTARQRDPDNGEALDRLLAVYEDQERWTDLAELYPEKIQRCTGDERVEHELSYATVLEEELERFDDAVEVYTAVLDHDAQNAEALEALEDLLQVDGADGNRIADVLDPIYAAGEQWSKLIGNYEVRLSQTEERATRLEHYRAMAKICEDKLEQISAAFYILSRAYGEGFQDTEVEEELFRLADLANHWPELAKELALAAEEAEDDPERRAAIHLRLGHLHEDKLEASEEATTYYEMVLEHDPDQPVALSALSDLYHAAERWSDWVRVQRRRIALLEKEEAEAAAAGAAAAEAGEWDEAGEAPAGESAEDDDLEVDVDDEVDEEVDEEVDDVEVEVEEETLDDLYLEVAEVLREELDDPVGAIELLEEARRAGRAVAETEEDLVELYVENERWSALADLLRDRVAETEEGPAAAALLAQLAQLHLSRLDDPDRALEYFQDALERDVTNAEVRAGLARLLDDPGRRLVAARLLAGAREAEQDWRGLAEALEVQIEESVAGEERGALLRRAAEVYEAHLDEPEVALGNLGRAFRESPTSDELRDELERLATLTGNYEMVSGLFQELAERLEFDERAVAVELYSRAAGHYIRRLELPEQAAECYRHVLDADPEHHEALKGLVEVCRAREDWEELADALSRIITVTSDEGELADLIHELGVLYDQQLEDTQRARENFEQVLSLQPAHSEALQALERIYEETEEWGPLFEIYERARELTDDEEEQVELTAKMADLAGEELDMRERAIDLWKEVLAAEPDDTDALEALEELYTVTERWPELVKIYRTQLESSVDDEEKVQLFMKLGYLRSEKVKDFEQARTDWICVLRLDPNNLTALAMLKEIYEAEEEWNDLTAILKRIANLQKNEDAKKTLLLRLASVYGEQLDRKQDAISTARQVMDLDPLDEAELDQLGAIFLTNEAWDEASDILDRKLELAEEVEEQVEVRRQIAEMWRDRAEDESRAAQEYEEILNLLPTNDVAFEALETIYRTRRDWMRLAALYEKRGAALIADEVEPAEIADHFAGLAEIYEKRLSDPAKAQVAWRRILGVDADHATARREVERLAAETGGFDDLAASLATLIEEAESPQAAVGLRLALARIQRDELEQADDAEAQFRAILEADPANTEALDACVELARKREGWSDLAELLEQRARAAEGDERGHGLAEAAEFLEERLEDRERATELRKELLDYGGEIAEQALDDLQHSLAEAEAWPELSEILERAVELAAADQERRERREALAKLCEEQLEDVDRAAELYREVVKESPRYRAGWKALERLYRNAEKWRELIEVYNKLVALAEEDGERIELYANAAAIWEEEFGERVMAVESLKKILALDPANLAAVASLERLYRQGEEWARLIEIYHKHIALSDDTTEIVALYTKIGEVYEHDLDRTDRAVDSYSQALNFDPRNELGLAALARLFEAAGRWERAIEMLERQAAVVDEEEQKTELLYRAGRLFESEMDNIRRARSRYRQALEVSPGYLPALRALKGMAQSDGNWDEFLRLLIQEEQYTESRPDKARLLVELGLFYRDRRDDDAAAIERFQAALDIEPELTAAIGPLAELYFDAEEFAQARPLLETVQQGLDEDDDRADLCVVRFRLGRIAEAAEDLPGALEHYRVARRLDPEFLPALEGTGRVHFAEGDWEEAEEIYEEVLEKHLRGRTDAESLDLYVRLGTTYLELGRLDDAAALFGRALRIDREHAPSLRAMVRVCEAREDWEEVINYQEQLVESLEEDRERQKILLAIGDVYYEHLDDPYEAIDTYNQALGYDPSDFEVSNRLYRLFRETGQWQEAARVLERVLRHEQAPPRIALFKQALGEIYLAKLDEVDRAVRCFQDILELDPTKVEASEAIEDLLTENEDWGGLENHYRRMIKLIPKRERARRIELWQKLGELYGLQMENVEGAIMAFEVLSNLEPDNYKHLETLAELYTSSEKHREKAVETYQRLAQLSPVPVLAFKALRRLYAESREYDKVFCLCATLRFLKEATTEEETFYRKFLPKAKMKTSRVITDESWQNNLIESGAQGPATQIFGYLYRYGGNALAPGSKLTKVKRKDRIDPNDSLLFFCKMFNYVAKAMNVDRPELYRAEGGNRGITVADSSPPTFLLGADMFKDLPKRDLWYLIGRHLTYARSEFILARILPPEALRSLLAAVITAFLPNHPADADPREIEKWQRRVIRTLPGEVQDHLLELSREYARTAEGPFDANRWLEGVEYTANRSGFVICNDLEVAMQQLVARREIGGVVPHRSLVRDLVHYSVSEDYFALRGRLGFSIMT